MQDYILAYQLEAPYVLEPVLLRNVLQDCFEEDLEMLADCAAVASACGKTGKHVLALTDATMYHETA